MTLTHDPERSFGVTIPEPSARKSVLLLDNQAPSRRKDHVIHSDVRAGMLLEGRDCRQASRLLKL
jgi:hypothetical protein